MNSVYFLTYNMGGGDDCDTWMWTDEDERKRFDCSKLEYTYMLKIWTPILFFKTHTITQLEES